MNEFIEHENAIWGRRHIPIRTCKGQTRIICNELESTIPEVKTLSENRKVLFILHMFEKVLKERNPEYVRFCESNDYKKIVPEKRGAGRE